jgi:hypothetical protein
MILKSLNSNSDSLLSLRENSAGKITFMKGRYVKENDYASRNS